MSELIQIVCAVKHSHPAVFFELSNFDALVKSRKTARSSFRRKPEPCISDMFWTPAPG